MARTLDDKIYSDRELTCRCGRKIADIRLDGQVLVIGSLVFFNALFWRCLGCNRASSYLAPTLPNEKPTLDNQFPDTQQIERRANRLKEKFHKVGSKTKELILPGVRQG